MKVVKAIFTAVKINFYCGKNQYPRWQKSISTVVKKSISTVVKKSISTVVKINFFPPVTRANFRAGYACTGSTLI